MSSTTTNSTARLQNLLTRFGVEHLGEGDTVTGANMLAAMACSIANVQRPGSGFVTEGGETIAVGTSLIVSGARSVSLISEKVLAGLATRQNNLASQLSKKIQGIPKRPTNLMGATTPPPEFFMKMQNEPISDRLFQSWAWPDPKGAAQEWSYAVETPVENTLQDLISQPMVFVTGITPQTLGPQLERSHLGRPLMHVGVASAKDFSRFEQICPTIMDGRINHGETMKTIRGTVMVTDPSGVLGEAIKADLPDTRWISRLLWLVDGDAGPELGKPAEDKTLIPLDRLAVRYETAMATAWGERLNCLTTAPRMLGSEFSESQARWMTFLKTLEPQCPGISGTARNLLATLSFGLRLIVNATEISKGFEWFTDEEEALARFLVQRMVNARAAILHSAEDERMRNIEASLIRKLGDGPQSDRELQRRFSRLNIDTCRKALHNLKGRGIVALVDNKWQRVETVNIPAALSN
jgi:hypothetical protein